jgi:uncharacterized SAM-binding protein YcdF (DUF218 family)
MFFIISKILAFLISPIVWIFGLIVAAILVNDWKKSRRLLVICLFVLFIFSNEFLLNEAMRLWEIQVTKTSDIKQTYDCGIVLGGGMVTYDDDYDRIAFHQNTDRIMQAVYLYKIGKIKTMLISSGSGSLVYRDMLEASLLKKYFVSIGIPDSVILVDSLSDNTRQNAVNSAPILKKRFPHGKFLMITSAFHMRRAIACFRHEGIIADKYSTNKYGGKRRYYFDRMFIPNLNSLLLWDKLIHEIFGYCIYGVFGYL